MPLIKINELTEEHFLMIETMAGTGFLPREIAEVLEVNNSDFMTEYLDNSSVVYMRYRKGKLLSEVKLRQRIFKDAGFGSSPAQTLAKKIMDDCDYQLKSYE